VRPYDVLLETILTIEHSRALIFRQADLDIVLVKMAHIMDNVGAKDTLSTCHYGSVVEQTNPSSAA
jgi:hypothetical protein